MRITLFKGWTVALATAVALCIGACALADTPAETSASSPESGVWTQKELIFKYTGFTTTYTCDGLTDKMRKLLLRLGARENDLQVRGYGCTHTMAPDPTAGVQIRMHVLEPAVRGAGQVVPARWESVDLLAPRDPPDAAGDCELISQFKQNVMPLFATRNVDYAATCSYRNPVAGGTRLKAEVLVPDTRTGSGGH